MNLKFKGKVKRILAGLLCLSMLAGFMPTFAGAPVAQAADEYFTVDFTSNGLIGGIRFPYAKFEDTNNKYAFFGVNPAWKDYVWTDIADLSPYNQVIFATNSGEWFAIELGKVSPGWYDTTFSYTEWKSGGILRFYLIPKTEGMTVEDIDLSTAKPLGKIDTYAKAQADVMDKFLGRFEVKANTDYLLVVQDAGKNASSANSVGLIKNLKFVPASDKTVLGFTGTHLSAGAGGLYTNFATVDYELTGNTWAYKEHANLYADRFSAVGYYYGQMALGNKGHAAYKVNFVSAGDYTATANYFYSSVNGGDIEFYLMPYADVIDVNNLPSSAFMGTVSNKLVGTYSNPSATNVVTKDLANRIYVPSAGEYLLVLKGTTTNNMFMLRDITFTCKEKLDRIAIASSDFRVGSILDPDITLFDPNGNECITESSYTMEIVSDPGNIIVKNANGDMFATAQGDVTIKITATLASTGATASLTVPITIGAAKAPDEGSVYLSEVETRISYNSLGVGEKAEILSTVGKRSDGSEIVDLTHAYVKHEAVDNAGVIALGADNSITALKAGTAAIKTTFIAEGVMVVGKTVITVDDAFSIAGVDLIGAKETKTGEPFKLVPQVILGNGDSMVPAGAKFKYEIISGGEFISVVGDKITAGNSVGEAVVKVSVDYRGKTTVSEAITLYVKDTLAALSGATAKYDFRWGVYVGETDVEASSYGEYTAQRSWAYAGAAIGGLPNNTAATLTESYFNMPTEAVGDYVAFKIKVPQTGRYQPALHAAMLAGCGIFDVYAIPLTEDAAANPTLYCYDAYHMGQIDAYDYSGTSKVFELNDIYLEKGEYLLVMRVSGTSGNGYKICPKSLELDGESVVKNVTVTTYMSKLGFDEQADFTVSATMSDGTAVPLEDAKVEFAVSEENAEYLTADCKAMTFRTLNKAGTAPLSIRVTYKDYSAVGSANIIIDDAWGINKNAKALLYGETVVFSNDILIYTPAIVLNNQTIVEVTSPAPVLEITGGDVDAVELIKNNSQIRTLKAGTVTVRGTIAARGNVYQTEELTLTILEKEPSKENFVINTFKFGHSGDSFEYLNQAEEYTDSRPWKFVRQVGYIERYANILLGYSSNAWSQIVFDRTAPQQYVMLRAKLPTAAEYKVSLYSTYLCPTGGRFELYIIPYTEENDANVWNLMKTGNEYYVGQADFYDRSSRASGTREFGQVKVDKGGEYIMVFKCINGTSSSLGQGGHSFFPTTITLENKKSMGSATIELEDGSNTIGMGMSAGTKLRIFNTASEEIGYDPSELSSVTYGSSDTSIATIDDNGVITGVSEGRATMRAVVTYHGVTKTAEITLNVKDSSTIMGITAVADPESIYIYGKTNLKAVAAMESGNKIVIPAQYVTWDVLGGAGVVEIAEDGTATGKTVGTAKLRAKVSGDWKQGAEAFSIQPITIDVTWDSSVELTIYTAEDRENVKKNAARYSWAKNDVETAKKEAEFFVENMQTIYDLMVPEGLPRYYSIGHKDDPFTLYCRYCKANIGFEYGVYGWQVDPVNMPWKIQCPDCRRWFPSNDFGSFYKLGLTESGAWDYQKALDANQALVDAGETGYLVNKEYPEKDEELGVTGWGVDDGFGYHEPYFPKGNPGYEPLYSNPYNDGKAYYNKNGWKPIRHNYIAYYLHQGIWYINGSLNRAPVVYKGLDALAKAFVYTGEAKYGRAGAIILDRVADLYPDFDWYSWREWRGDTYRGTMVDTIWTTDMTDTFIEAYDAFKPIYNDPYVVEYLSENAARYEVAENGDWKRDENGELIPVNLKDTPGAVRKNVEDRILRQTFENVKKGKLWGNFGMHQRSLAKAAVALNSMPETGEMLDWIMKPGSGTNANEYTGDNTGGNVLSQLLVEVDRDGHGTEISPDYNAMWVGALMSMADVLRGYKLYPAVDLFENIKFLKMVGAQMELALGGYYTPAIGDAGSPVTRTLNLDKGSAFTAFKYTKDPDIAKKLYAANNNSIDGLRGTIFDAEPEGIAQEILQIVREQGEFSLATDMLAGYGFAALRAGGKYSSAVSAETVDTNRDFAVTFTPTAGHTHKDALNMHMSAFGLNLSPDLGYPAYTGDQPYDAQWTKATISHNTVVVDKADQRPNGLPGEPYHFDDGGRVKLLDASMNAYPQVKDYRRTVLMIEAGNDISYGVDFFHVYGGDDHMYTFHASSEDVEAVYGLGNVNEYPTYVNEDGETVGTYAGPDVVYGPDPGGNSPANKYPYGYTWLYNVRQYNSPEKEFSVDFKIKDPLNRLKTGTEAHLKMTVVNDEPFDEVALVTGSTKAIKVLPEMEYILIRNTGSNIKTTYTTVLEPYEKGKEYLEKTEKVSMTRDENVKPGLYDSNSAIKVTHLNGRVDYVMYSTNTDIEFLVDNKIRFRGFAGVITLDGDGDDAKVIYSYLNDGDILALANDAEAQTSVAAYTGTVASFTENVSKTNSIVYTPTPGEDVDTEALANKYVYIDNPGSATGDNGAYRILGAKELANGDIELDVGTVTLVNGFKDANDISLGYTYNIAKNQTLRIPLTSIFDGTPVFTPQARKTATTGKRIGFAVYASSPIGNELTYEAVALPRGAIFNAATNTISWIPDDKQIGKHVIGIAASDGKLNTVQYIEVEVFRGSSIGSGGDSSGGGSSDSGASGGGAGGSGGGGSSGGGSSAGGSTDTGSSGGSTGSTGGDTPSTGGNAGSATAEKFTDLANHAWAKDAIYALVEKGIVNGTSESTYSPAANIKRADFAIMLVRAFGITEGDGETFADVDSSKYYAEELRLAKANGIVNGIGDNKFGPDGEITRQDMMLMLHRALVAKGYELDEADASVLSQFVDAADIADYAQDAVASLVNGEYIAGANGKINPKGKATRAEVAVLLGRIFGK